MPESGSLTVRCVGALVFDSRGRLLLIQRAHDPEAGRWSLPGGRVEPDETDAQALRRELLEETSLLVTVGDRIGSVQRYVGKTTLDIHDYRCLRFSGELRPGDDAADATWVDHATLITMNAAGQLSNGLYEFLTGHNVLPG
ncbi:NUDIX domain-containing protein [Pseudonocardiaceae bacterium YIM PH 21723]|nr:NUDIX domain-containing protein [Pseudonocardiaceae bacterium YIM PH 21723]